MVNIFKHLFFIIFFIFILETSFRVIVPEYSNRSITNNNINNNFYYSKPLKGSDVTIRDSKDFNNDNFQKIYILGDSITKGFGLAYKDTFYSVAENMLFLNNANYQVVPFSLFNFKDTTAKTVIQKFKEYYSKIKIKKGNDYLIYQFNYNDVIQNNYSDNLKLIWDVNEQSFFQKIIFWSGKFRYQYLNKSTFLTFLQVKFSNALSNRNKECSIYSLESYTFSYGTKGYEKESVEAWKNFKNDLENLLNFSEENNLKFKVLIIPTILDFKYQGSSNPKNYNLKCATIKPREKLKNILNELNIDNIDPTENMKAVSSSFVKENNPKNFFINLDHNHLNERGSRIIGEHLFLSLYKEIETN